MNILKVRTYGHLYTLASMMGREGSGQKHSDPKAEWKVWVCRSFVYDAKVICQGGNAGNREDGLTEQITADIFQVFIMFKVILQG